MLVFQRFINHTLEPCSYYSLTKPRTLFSYSNHLFCAAKLDPSGCFRCPVKTDQCRRLMPFRWSRTIMLAFSRNLPSTIATTEDLCVRKPYKGKDTSLSTKDSRKELGHVFFCGIEKPSRMYSPAVWHSKTCNQGSENRPHKLIRAVAVYLACISHILAKCI